MSPTVGAAVATACTALLLVGLLIGERRHAARVRYATKPLASLGFVLVPIFGGALAPGRDVALWIEAGLVFGAIGDVLLLSSATAAFAGGLGAFLVGHVAYVIAFAIQVPPGRWIEGPMPAVILPIAALAVAVVRWLWPHLGSLRGPVLAYVGVICTMMIGAVACALSKAAPADATTRSLEVAGAALFFASDLSVARDRFVAEGFVNRAWGLPAYYAGQLLLAWSTLPR